jgi:Fe-S cluster biogenesis protein NfuA
MLYDGGGLVSDLLEENEGYAVVRETSQADQQAFREIQMYAATHVMADGGAIICSPIWGEGTINVGFVGRCQICPNAEVVSFQQLKKTITQYSFDLWPEWKNWSIGERAAV